ncbi:MAG: hypothetical protein WBM62_02515 [Crocosphaera sp.]
MNNFLRQIQPFDNLQDELYFLLLTLVLLETLQEDVNEEEDKEIMTYLDEESLQRGSDLFFESTEQLFRQVS